jgi:hypothetical protein
MTQDSDKSWPQLSSLKRNLSDIEEITPPHWSIHATSRQGVVRGGEGQFVKWRRGRSPDPPPVPRGMNWRQEKNAALCEKDGNV